MLMPVLVEFPCNSRPRDPVLRRGCDVQPDAQGHLHGAPDEQGGRPGGGLLRRPGGAGHHALLQGGSERDGDADNCQDIPLVAPLLLAPSQT